MDVSCTLLQSSTILISIPHIAVRLPHALGIIFIVSGVSPPLPLLLLVFAIYPLMIKLKLQLDAIWLGLLLV